jgi:hypothetical protein
VTRKRGLAVTLGVYYLHAAWRCGLTVKGVDFPGHFLLRIETEEGPLAGALEALQRATTLDGGATLQVIRFSVEGAAGSSTSSAGGPGHREVIPGVWQLPLPLVCAELNAARERWRE